MGTKKLTGTIEKTSCEGMCARVKLNAPVKNRWYALVDERTKTRTKILNRGGGVLTEGTVLNNIQAEIIGNDLVTIYCD